ncbi:MAG: hypothetical protein LBG46_01060 [Elusimicrobiota bacterium]|jgi:hypothetical protein|nr:hypothetical protein [Elusimicrobiota bacterium]
MQENKPSYIPLYKEAAQAVLKQCGALALGCFAAMANKADYSAGWVLEISTRDLSELLGVSRNTLYKSILPELQRYDFIEIASAGTRKSKIIIKAFLDIEAGKTLKTGANFEPVEKIKKQTGAKIEPVLAALFPEFMIKVGPDTLKTGANFEPLNEEKKPENAEISQTGAKIEPDMSAQTGAKIEPVAQKPPLIYPPHNDFLINIKGENQKPKKQKNMPPNLEAVKNFFLEKKFTGSPEDFFYKNEARNWQWTDRSGKTHKIKNWKGTAWEFEKKEKQNGAVNWNDPRTPAEKLFCWYYKAVMPESFNDVDARLSRWNADKGHCAHICSVVKGFEGAKALVEYGAEKLEKANFAASLRAIANNAFTYCDEIEKAKYGGR